MGLKRTPLKRNSFLSKGNSTLKKGGGLKKSSSLKKKPKTIEQKKEQEERWRKDIEFYTTLWQERNHVCVSCDKYLGDEMNLMFFEHGLPKSTYPQYRYCKENLSLVCQNCHSLKEAGFPTEKYKIKLDELLDKHKKGLLK